MKVWDCNSLPDAEKMDVDIICALRSGEMHNGFVVCNRYNITFEKMCSKADEIRKDIEYYAKVKAYAQQQLDEIKESCAKAKKIMIKKLGKK